MADTHINIHSIIEHSGMKLSSIIPVENQYKIEYIKKKMKF